MKNNMYNHFQSKIVHLFYSGNKIISVMRTDESMNDRLIATQNTT